MLTRIQDAINSQSVLTPFQLGQYDARKNELCVPEEYYGSRIDRTEYARGHASIKATLGSAGILGLSFVPAEVA